MFFKKLICWLRGHDWANISLYSVRVHRVCMRCGIDEKLAQLPLTAPIRYTANIAQCGTARLTKEPMYGKPIKILGYSQLATADDGTLLTTPRIKKPKRARKKVGI